MTTTPAQTPEPPGRHLRRLVTAWTALIPEEQRALAIILGLFLFGVAIRFWHLMHNL